MKFDAVRHFGSYRPDKEVFKKISSYSDTTLYVGLNNSKSLDKALSDLLSPFQDKTVQIFTKRNEERNYAIIGFKDKEDAREALKLLSSNGYFVKPAYGKEKDETNLFIKNLPSDKSQDEVKDIFHDILTKLELSQDKLISIKFLNKLSNDVPSACMIRFKDAETSKLVLDHITSNNEYQLECRFADKAIYNPSNYNYNNTHNGHNFRNPRKSNNMISMHNYSRMLTPHGYVQFNALNHFQNMALLQANNPRFYSPLPYIPQTTNNPAFNLYQPFQMNNSLVPGTILNSYMTQKPYFDNTNSLDNKVSNDKNITQDTLSEKSNMKNLSNNKNTYNTNSKYDSKPDSNMNKTRSNLTQLNSNHLMRGDFNQIAAAAAAASNGQYPAILNPGYQLNGYPVILPQIPVMMNTNANAIRLQPSMNNPGNVATLPGNLTNQNNFVYQLGQGTPLVNHNQQIHAQQNSTTPTPSNGQPSKMLYYSFDANNGNNPNSSVTANPQITSVTEAQNYFINSSHIQPQYSILYPQQQSHNAGIANLNHHHPHQYNHYPSNDHSGSAQHSTANHNSINGSSSNQNFFYLMPNYSSGNQPTPNGNSKKLFDPMNALQSQFSAINLTNGAYIHPSQLTSNDSVKSNTQIAQQSNALTNQNGSSNATSSSSSALPQQTPKKLYDIISTGVNNSES